jgi:hypothetical protein
LLRCMSPLLAHRCIRCAAKFVRYWSNSGHAERVS